jgi:hypothetical protein
MFASFNLTFLFEITQTNLSQHENLIVILFRSRETLIHLNFSRLLNSPKLEITHDSMLMASFNVDINTQTQQVNVFSFCIDEHNIALTLNSRQKISMPLTEDYLEFFQSDFIEMSTQKLSTDTYKDLRVVIHRVYINGHRLALSNGTSRQYETLNMRVPIEETNEFKEDTKEISTRFDGNESGKKMNKLLISTQTIFLNSWNHPTPILIIATILVMFIFALIALLSIIINIYVRRQKRDGEQRSVISNSIQTTQTSNSSASSLSELTTRITQHQNGHYFQYDSLKCASTRRKASALNSISKKLSGMFLGGCGGGVLENNNFHSQANLIMSFNQHQNVSTFSNETSCLFNVNDLYMLKDTLNWQPAFEIYKNVFNEMETFAAVSMKENKEKDLEEEEEVEICRGGGALVLGNNLVLESNFNKNYGHQTFV